MVPTCTLARLVWNWRRRRPTPRRQQYECHRERPGFYISVPPDFFETGSLSPTHSGGSWNIIDFNRGTRELTPSKFLTVQVFGAIARASITSLRLELVVFPRESASNQQFFLANPDRRHGIRRSSAAEVQAIEAPSRRSQACAIQSRKFASLALRGAAVSASGHSRPIHFARKSINFRVPKKRT